MTGAVRHFLDHNAGAPLLPAARARMIEVLDLAGNPSSVHAEGRAARAVVEQARAEIAALCGTRPDRVLFTSGGSESNAWMLHQARGHQARGHQAAVGRLAVSAVEHDSVLAAAPDAPRIPVDDQGVVHPHAVAAVLDRLPDGGAGALVAVMAVNNETGVIQPVAEIAALVHARGGRVACDAVQAAGRLDLGTLCGAVDFLSLSAHKIGGPKGVGVLVVGPEIEPAALIPGGQEYRRRGGTENLAGIAGFGAAAAVLGATDRAAEAQRLAALRDRIQKLLDAGYAEHLEFFAAVRNMLMGVTVDFRQRVRIWRELSAAGLLETLERDGRQPARELVRRVVEKHVSLSATGLDSLPK